MHIELVGCTNAGKSTLAKRIADTACADGIDVMHGTERVVRQLGLSGTKQTALRAIAIHLVAAMYCLLCIGNRARFVWLSFRVLRSMPIPMRQRWNQFRKVLKQLGCFESIARRDREETIVIVDEGTVHAAHNLFVHVGGNPDHRDIARFGELVPLPDVVICIRETEDVLIERSIRRPHPRVPVSAPQAAVAAFLRNAVETFDLLCRHERIAPRTIVVDGQDVMSPRDGSDDPHIQLVTQLIQRAIANDETKPEKQSLLTSVT